VTLNSTTSTVRIMVFGSGSSTQGVIHALRERGAEVSAYIKSGGTAGTKKEENVYLAKDHPNPCAFLKKKPVDFVIPMSIDWIMSDWAEEFLSLGIPVLSPQGEGMQLERSRDFAKELCEKYGVPFPRG